jgi:integrase
MDVWTRNLNSLMAELAHSLRADGDKGSDRTQDATKAAWNRVKTVLHKLGHKVQDPRNLGTRHIEIVVKYWWYGPRRLKPKTMETYLNRLRVVCNKINKRGMVKTLRHYLPEVAAEDLVVSTVATKSKSWNEAGVDIRAKIEEADGLDWRFGIMIRVMLAFGLRRKEVLTCHPSNSVGGGIVWRINPGEGKGGRPRVIVITTQLQRDVIKFMESKLQKGERLRWKKTPRGLDCNIERGENLYKSRMKQLGMTLRESGVTGHGLRAQYAENDALRLGLVPPTLGGNGGELPKQDRDVIRSVVAENLGHSRPSVTRSYYGSFPRAKTTHEKDRLKLAVEEGLEELKKSGPLEMPAEERKDDCIRMIGALAEHDVAISMSQIHALWIRYSSRQNSPWLSLEDAGQVERGIYVAATMHRRSGNPEGKEE